MNTFHPGSKMRFHKALGIWFLLTISLAPFARAQSSTTAAVGRWSATLITRQTISRPQPNNRAAKVLFGLTDPFPQTQETSPVTKVFLEVDKEKIYVRHKDQVLREIPASEVAATGYDYSSHSKGWAWLAAAVSPNLYNSGGPGTPFILAPFLVGAAVAAPFKTTEHYVRIFWNGAEGPDEILMEVGKNDYADVLAGLQRVTGKPWHDLPKEREKLRVEIDKTKSAKKQLILDRAVFVNGEELKSGMYQLVLLERAENLGEVYFFRGANVKGDEVAAQAVVEIDKQNHSAGAVVPAYGTEAGVATITSLAMPEETLRLTSSPLPARVENAARRFYGGSDKWATVMRTNHEGEPAFRFTIFHLEYPNGCTGYLYVTRQRIVFARGPSSGLQCNTFAVARTDVQAKGRGADWVGRYLQLKSKEKTYNFYPVFEEKGEQQLGGAGKSGKPSRRNFPLCSRIINL